MSVVRIILSLLVLLAAAAEARTVALIADVVYENRARKGIDETYVRLHLPHDTFYQTLTGLSAEGVGGYRIGEQRQNAGRYVELRFGVPAHSVKKIRVRYTFELKPQQIRLTPELLKGGTPPEGALQAAGRIESGSRQIRAIAALIANADTTLLERLKRAYEFPAAYLRYEPAHEKTSALRALQSGKGDCTEYAYLFVALSRALGIPARVVSVFAFEKRREFAMPNHDMAEIYTDRYGWFPVYPNLSGGGYDNAYRLGNVSGDILVFKHEKNWTWSDYLPKRNGVDRSEVNVGVTWSVEAGTGDE